MTERPTVLAWIRWGALILSMVLITTRVGTHGLDRSILVSAVFFVLFGGAFLVIETRTRRPVQTHLRWGLATVALGILLVALPLLGGMNAIVGAILWIGLSAAGLVWALYYERTEPL